MKTRRCIAMLATAALLASGGATGQQYGYSYDVQPYGGTYTITTPDGRGGVTTRTIIHGPGTPVMAIIHPKGALTTGAMDQFGNWYTITTPGAYYRDPRSVR